MPEMEKVGKHRHATVFKVTYPTIPSFKLLAKEAALIQKQENHDILLLTYYFMKSNTAKLLKTGVPVKFTWKQGARRMEWLGYVHSVRRRGGVQNDSPTEVYCMGASFVLKNGQTKTYKNKTIPQVVAQIAKENKLKFVGESHPRVFEQLTVAGHSQWEWICEQARRIGYVVFIEGTTLNFRAVDKLLDEESTDAPLFQLWNPNTPKTSQQVDRTLDELKVLDGENIEDDGPYRSVKRVGGVDPVTGRAFTASKSPVNTGTPVRTKISDALFDEYNSEQVVNDPVAARSAAEGSAHLARFKLPATATGQGDPRVRPYQLVYVEGSSDQADGHWLVKSVTHKFTSMGNYSTEMQIASDGTEKNRKGARRSSTRRAVGVVNLPSLLTRNTAFNTAPVGTTINLGVELNTQNGGSQTASRYTSAAPTDPRYLAKTSRLAIRRPMFTDFGNQGFNRTPSRWETTSPSSTMTKKKCGCCRG